MAEFASNVPVSRPVNPGWTSDWDMNGMQWSYDYGMFYAPEDDFLPIRLPSPRVSD